MTNDDGITRRAAMALAAVGALGAASALPAGGDSSLGGGSAADGAAEYRVRYYRGPLDERPEAGVAGRVWEAESDGALYFDDGGSWTLADRRAGSFIAEQAGIDLHTQPYDQLPVDLQHDTFGEQPSGRTLLHFQDFDESSDDWTISATNGDIGDTTVELTSDEVIAGLRALKIEEHDGVRTHVSREYDAPIDLSGTDFSVLLNPESVPDDDENRLRFYLWDSEDNVAALQASTRSYETSGPVDGEWIRLGFCWRDSLHIDSIDLSDIVEVQVRSQSSAGPRTLYLADLRVHERANVGTMFWKLDDGFPSQYEEAFPILKKYGFAGGLFMETDNIGSNISVDELKEMERHGWDICSHATDNIRFDELTAEETEEEVIEAKEALLEHGFRRGARFFHPPGINMTEESLKVVRKHHEMSMGTGAPDDGAGAGLRARGAHMQIRPYGGDIVSDAKDAVDRIIKFNAFGSVTWHAVDDPSDFEEVAEYVFQKVRDGDLRVVTPSQFYDSWPTWQSGMFGQQ